MDEKRKEAYVAKQTAELQKIDADLKEMEAKIESTEADVKIEKQKQLEELKQKRAELNDRLEKLVETGTNAWKDVKRLIELSKKDIKRSIKHAVNF